MAESDYYSDLSLILHRVMDDIGVNEECILRGRKTMLLTEKLYTLNRQQSGERDTCYIFGSQSEGATTDGLHSDLDSVKVRDEWNVIQDLKDWVFGKMNLLMIETEYPGYCKLQVLRNDEPLPEQNLKNTEYYVYDEQGRVVHNNLVYLSMDSTILSSSRNGPALSLKIKGGGKNDYVMAYPCKTWPKQYRRMSLCRRPMNWPTPEMIRYIEASGFYVVPTDHRLSTNPELGWRISTSLAERCLMFSLNITQIRCYLLLKMIVKTFIEPHVPDMISSYICKTVLFHCIEGTALEFWKERNLLHCVDRVLQYILAALHNMNCPIFFNISANLFLGKLDGVKQKKLIDIFRTILQSKGRFLLQIPCDNVNGLFVKYITDNRSILSMDSNEYYRNTYFVICLESLLLATWKLNETITGIEDKTRLLRITENYAKKGSFQAEISEIVFPYLCSYLACIEANESILRGKDLTPNTLLLFILSLNFDVTSSRLRYASYVYCTGQWQRTLTILEDVEQRLLGNIMPLCQCHDLSEIKMDIPFIERQRRRCLSTKNIALCVMFRQSEIQCCPLELRYEMFRSTTQDMPYRNILHGIWMYNAVIHPLPYILFLKYKAYRYLGQLKPAKSALVDLLYCVMEYPLLSHRDTGLNLLGQCFEHERMYDEALKSYELSLGVRQRNNAAKWHIGRFLSSLINATGTSVIYP